MPANPAAHRCTCGCRSAAAAPLHIRRAHPGDDSALLTLVGELAAYEHLSHELEATAAHFNEHLFGPNPRATALLAHRNGNAAGFAVWYSTYSTFSGRPGAFLEDLYVRPPFRRQGIGRALLAATAADARAAGCARLEWRALKWNEPALALYRTLGAEPLAEWLTLRLDEPHLSAL